jgi:hypothetical protein
LQPTQTQIKFKYNSGPPQIKQVIERFPILCLFIVLVAGVSSSLDDSSGIQDCQSSNTRELWLFSPVTVLYESSVMVLELQESASLSEITITSGQFVFGLVFSFFKA